jgi:hypothetical protein
MGKYSNTIYDEALNNSWTVGCKKNMAELSGNSGARSQETGDRRQNMQRELPGRRVNPSAMHSR